MDYLTVRNYIRDRVPLSLRKRYRTVRDGVRNLLLDEYTVIQDRNPKFGKKPPTSERIWRKIRYVSGSRGIPLTENERKLASLANTHKGRRAFLIGNGPSLNKCDLKLLKNEITFGVNAIYLNYKNMGFNPTYYVVEDIFVAEDRAEEIKAYSGPKKFIGDYLRYCLEGSNDTIWVNIRYVFDSYPEFPHFSTDCIREIWVGGTVSYVCMQLAFFMGIDTLFLIGFDHNYIIKPDATVSGVNITSNSDDPNHFHPGYFGAGYRWHDPLLSRMEIAYRKAKRIFEEHGRKIFNATMGGNLDVFERVDYNSLFEK